MIEGAKRQLRLNPKKISIETMPPKDKQIGTYLIDVVARRVGLSQKRLRDYEKSGLVSPARQPKTNNRLYSELDIERILRVKELIHTHGFTLASLRFFMASAPCWVIYRCKEVEKCPVSKNRQRRCFELARKVEARGHGTSCRQCPIYLNRHVKAMALLNRPG